MAEKGNEKERPRGRIAPLGVKKEKGSVTRVSRGRRILLEMGFGASRKGAANDGPETFGPTLTRALLGIIIPGRVCV